MKFFCGLIFALAIIALSNKGVARQTNKPQSKKTGVLSWQHYDSLAAVHVFNGDTISALEYYRKALELKPENEYARKNYERLNYHFIKSGQTIYDVNP